MHLKALFPPMQWVPEYDPEHLRGDLSAGLTVGVMLIPQGMAYALIAGLPPIYGLYASLVPLVAYALLGTSRQLAVGPVAMVSLLVAAGITPLAEPDSADYIALAIILALMVGALQLVLGLARFGFLVNFLSHPVLAGFTSAAALIIGASQLKNLLGVPIERSNYVYKIVASAIQQAGDIHVATVLIGIGSIAVLVLLRRWKPTFPGPLVAVVLTTVLVWATSAHEAGVSIVAAVPGGLPTPGLPAINLADLSQLAPTAIVIALVGFMESIAVAKAFASRHRYRVDANQELVALGVANIAGAFFRSFPTTGGFSRTAVNSQAGARSTLASIFSAAVILLTLLFLTPLFYYMPTAVLAAIIMVAVAGLVDLKEARFLWRVDRRDFALMMLTFAATLVLGIEEGIVVGIVASLILVIYQSTVPHSARLGRLPGTNTYRNIKRYPAAEQIEGVPILRVDASMYFANTEFVRDMLEEAAKGSRAVILDMYPVNRIDSTAAHALLEVVGLMANRGTTLLVSGAKGPVRDVLRRAGVTDRIGEHNFFDQIHAATTAAQNASSVSDGKQPLASRYKDELEQPGS
ncbi:MAG: solute carrier family 26 protein [Rhodothermia bacterium]|nr:solute carrier family 26 protein [Rhodothermia bacterium]